MLLKRCVRQVFLFKQLQILGPPLCYSSDASRRILPEYDKLQLDKNYAVEEPKKCLKVSIIGVPNAGKSTLINRLMMYDVCPVSRKAHTTRTNQNAVMLEDDTQVVFVDTPGVVNPKETRKFSLSPEFVSAPEDAVRNVDLIAVLHTIENKVLRNKLDPKVVGVLQKFPTKPAILIINKIDKIRGKRKLLETVFHLSEGIINGQPIPIQKKKRHQPQINNMEKMFRETKAKLRASESHKVESGKVPEPLQGPGSLRYDENGHAVRGWPNFRDVFLISALEGDGVEAVRDYLLASAITSPWAFNGEILTDCPPAELCLRIVKSKMLEHLQDEIPYILHPQLEFWDTNDEGVLRIVIGMTTPNERIQKMAVGKDGSLLHKIKYETEKNLSELFRTPVDIFINVTLKPQKKPKY